MAAKSQLQDLAVEEWKRAAHAERTRHFPVHGNKAVGFRLQCQVSPRALVARRHSPPSLNPLPMLFMDFRMHAIEESVVERNRLPSKARTQAAFQPPQHSARSVR